MEAEMFETIKDKHGRTWEFYPDQDGKPRWRCKAANGEITSSAHMGFNNMDDCLENARLPRLTCDPSPSIPDSHIFPEDEAENNLVATCGEVKRRIWQIFNSRDGRLSWRCLDVNGNLMLLSDREYDHMDDCLENARLPRLTCIPSQTIPDSHIFCEGEKEKMIATCEDEHGRIWQFYEGNNNKFWWRCRTEKGNKLLSAHKGFKNMEDCIECARLPGMTCDPSKTIPPSHVFPKNEKENNLVATCEGVYGRIWQIFNTKDGRLSWRCKDVNGKHLLLSNREFDHMDDCLKNARLPGLECDNS